MQRRQKKNKKTQNNKSNRSTDFQKSYPSTVRAVGARLHIVANLGRNGIPGVGLGEAHLSQRGDEKTRENDTWNENNEIVRHVMMRMVSTKEKSERKKQAEK